MEEIAKTQFIEKGLTLDDFAINIKGRYADSFPNLIYPGGGRGINVPAMREVLKARGFTKKAAMKEWWDSLEAKPKKRKPFQTKKKATKKEEVTDDLAGGLEKSKQEISDVLERHKGKVNPQIEQALDELEADTFMLDKSAGQITPTEERQTDMLTPADTIEDIDNVGCKK